MPKVACRAAVPLLAVFGLAAVSGRALAESARYAGPPVPLCARAPVPADSVRQLNVAIVLATNSFNKTLNAAEVERVHEEAAEFYAFYQQHGAGKVDFSSSAKVNRAILGAAFG